ncbi:flagellar hook-length control protein FliK [Clostridium massiliamazoniense]|uniref:flagellar hook-length control protein FliK n=1 Tax=Clostridium massiliamazoniense TaxID=1347366 RepID=UPI0006D7D984|nr:flagellar hook-length control protein FliK [Clostridium massiliamazoniense]
MKIDILSSMETLVVQSKSKEVKLENNFKDILDKATATRNQKDDIVDSKKSEVKKEINSTKDTEKKTIKNNENVVKDNCDNKEVIEEGLLDGEGLKVVEELMAFIMGFNEMINEDLKSVIDEMNLETSINELNEEVISRLLAHSNNELIVKNDLQEIINSLESVGFVEKDNFLVNHINEVLGNLVEELEKIDLVLENTPLVKENENIRVEIKNFIENGKAIIEKLPKNNILKDNSVHLNDENRLESEELIITSKNSEITKEKTETTFNNKGEENKEFSESEKEDLVLNKILGHEIKDHKPFIANKILSMNNENVGELKEVINVKSFSVDTVKNMKYMVNNSIKELVVKVNPGNLGDVTIKISMAGNEVKANISTASKELYNYINSSEIKNLLNQENIRVSEVNISLYQEDTTFFREGSEFNGRGNNEKERTFNREGFSALEEGIVEEVKDLSSLDIIV